MDNFESREGKELSSMTRFPWELIHLIFQYVVAPTSLMIPDRCRYSAWSLNLLTTQRLVTVCHSWYQPGIGFLYGDIAVYWQSQLSPLLWTLSSRPDLASKVSSLRFACHVPAETDQSAIEMFARLCPKLARLSVEQSSLEAMHPSRIHIPGAFVKLPLTHLCIHYSASHLGNILASPLVEQLVSLTLYSPHPYPPIRFTKQTDQCVCFPRLKTFECDLDSDQMAYITQYWEFPVLTSFLNQRLYKHKFHNTMMFIRKYRRTISTLLLRTYDRDFIQVLLSELDNLRHLIIPLIVDLSIPQIRHLDLIHPYPPGLPPIENQLDRFPNLVSYRSIDNGLIFLPWIYTDLIPPSLTDSERSYQFRFPGIDIRCSKTSVSGTTNFERALVGKNIVDDDFSSGSDSEWLPESGDSDTSDSEADYNLSDSEKEGLVGA